MEEQIKEKRKQKITILVGLITLLIAVLGATYAYFQIDTTSDNSNTTITGSTPKQDLVTLKGITSNLHLYISASDMSLANANNEYYATDVEKDPYEIDETKGTKSIAEVEVDGDEETTYSCTAKLTVSKVTTPDANKDTMVDFLKPGDLILQFKGNIISEQLDLSELKETGSKEYNLKFKVTGNTPEEIQAYIKLINKDDPNEPQNDIAGKKLNININTSDIDCEVFVPNTKLIAQLREKSDGKLTKNLVYGLYRYQGNSIVNSFAVNPITSEITVETTQTVNNNYICLGSDCSETSDDMYRIIGINEDGEMKVIKNTPSNDSIAWNSDAKSDIKWPQSELYKYLNIEFYNELSPSLKEKIVNATWLYGDVNQNNMSPEEQEKMEEYMRTAISGEDENEKKEATNNFAKLVADFYVTEEAKAIDKITGNISLMSITDYCSSFESDKKLTCASSHLGYYKALIGEDDVVSTVGCTWMTPSAEIFMEWTYSRFGFVDNSFNAYGVAAAGLAGGSFVSDKYPIRPVFFLTSDIELSNEGEGTIESPFKVVGIK